MMNLALLLQKLCADQGVSASTALLAWLHVQESQSQTVVNAEAESPIEVAFAVLPQVIQQDAIAGHQCATNYG